MNELLSAADAATVDADAPFPIPAPAHGALADFIRVHSRLAAEREAWLRESGDAAADAEVAQLAPYQQKQLLLAPVRQ